MGFEELLPKEESEEELVEEVSKSNDCEKIGQNQFYSIITNKQSDWQTIIYDLIHSEQLDPWDIDLVVLTKRYFEKILELEESNELVEEGDNDLKTGEEIYKESDFYVSSKVLLAASLLLRIKSEFLLNKHIRDIDEALFGKKKENKQIIERIEINEDEIPILMPKTPLARARRVTLPELMSALNKAINTESRRIKREVQIKRARKLSEVDIPTFKRIDLKDRIKQFYAKILTSLKKRVDNDGRELNKISFSELVGREKEEKLASFLPLLHLSNTKKLWLEQEFHLEEIWVFLYEHFSKNRDKFLEDLEEDIEEMKEELEINNEDLENVEGEKLSGLERARLKNQAKKQMQDEIKRELAEELGQEIKKEIIEEISEEAKTEIKDIEKEEKIDKISGFEG